LAKYFEAAANLFKFNWIKVTFFNRSLLRISTIAQQLLRHIENLAAAAEMSFA
jgi:hypothetical protein